MGKKQRRKKPSAPLIEVLEPRLLFSADFMGVLMDSDAGSAVDLFNAVTIDTMEDGQTAEELQFSFSNTLDDEFLVHAPTAFSDVDPGDARHELSFIDPSAPDYQ